MNRRLLPTGQVQVRPLLTHASDLKGDETVIHSRNWLSLANITAQRQSDDTSELVLKPERVLNPARPVERLVQKCLQVSACVKHKEQDHKAILGSCNWHSTALYSQLFEAIATYVFLRVLPAEQGI